MLRLLAAKEKRTAVMGIDNRDYLREDRPSGLGRPDATVIPWIIGINVIIFLVDSSSRFQWSEALHLTLDDLWPRLQLWRLLTYGFCHGNTAHLFFNMYALWMFGKYIEAIYGAKEFLAFYLAGILAAAAGFLLFAATQDQPIATVGASGGVMAVTILTAMHFPQAQVLLFFIIPMPLKYLALVIVAIDVAGVFNTGGQIANAAHLGGAAFGFLYFKMGWRLTQWSRNWKLPGKRRPPVKLYDPGPDSANDIVAPEVVDALLQKINDQGEASLTDEERRTLIAASRQYTRRRAGRP